MSICPKLASQHEHLLSARAPLDYPNTVFRLGDLTVHDKFLTTRRELRRLAQNPDADGEIANWVVNGPAKSTYYKMSLA